MNIFAVSRSPRKCAKALDDIRVGKMILETAQMLCTVLNLEAGNQITQYKNSHETNKLIIWAMKKKHFAWLWELGMELGDEYIYRFGKKHASHLVIEGLTFNWPDRCQKGSMPDTWHNAASHKKLGLDFSHLPPKLAYKKYLKARWKLQSKTPRKNGQIVGPKWTNRKKPSWS